MSIHQSTVFQEDRARKHFGVALSLGRARKIFGVALSLGRARKNFGVFFRKTATENFFCHGYGYGHFSRLKGYGYETFCRNGLKWRLWLWLLCMGLWSSQKWGYVKKNTVIQFFKKSKIVNFLSDCFTTGTPPLLHNFDIKY